jgi:hypothetical protein
VNVSVLEYVPVRSGSVALMGCMNAIATGSLDRGGAGRLGELDDQRLRQRERAVHQVARVQRLATPR